MTGDFDLGYKQLFAHPELVLDLLAGFTPFPWTATLTPADFERVNASYVSDTQAERHSDLVWRVRLGEQFLYVYLLLEFQSRTDRWMALRMHVYVGLLYQDLLRRGATAGDGRLPPVLPIVFYNGSARWHAREELAELVASPPEGLTGFQAAQRYLLIDQRHLDRAMLARQRSVLATLFELELSDYSEVVQDVLATLATWWVQHADTVLGQSIGRWVDRHLLRRRGQHEWKGWRAYTGKEAAVYPRRYATWYDQAIAEGKAEALRPLLVKVLGKRFQVVPDDISRRVADARGKDLERWLHVALDASTDEQVLASLRSRSKVRGSARQ